jgi:hypothetical protein
MKTAAITAQRDTAIQRGLAFIYHSACCPKNFEMYGHDYLCCFYCIGATSRNTDLRRIARSLGRERARQWRREHRSVTRNADATEVANLIMGSDAADRLGVRDTSLKEQLRKIAAQFRATDYFDFEPASEPPPIDVPEDCDCGAWNPRGRNKCKACKRPLTMYSRYWVWLNAITLTYTAERFGVRFGSTFRDVLKWLPVMRRYPNYDNGDNPDFFWAIYAVTHVVYALNDYSSYRLSPSWLPNEYRFLKNNLVRAVAMKDPETMGEFLDTLKSFGHGNRHILVRKGMRYLLSQQNADGSWGDVDSYDEYQRYHPTWTAIDGLRDYAWKGKRLSLERLRPLLKPPATPYRRKEQV